MRMGHESYDRPEDIQGSSNRSFGLVFGGFFAIVGLLPLVTGGQIRYWALLVGAVFLVLGLAIPSVLAPLSRVWMKFGHLLHRIVSPIVLGIMFFLVVTPVGVLMRLLGKDPLRLKSDREAKTYWIAREPPGPAPESLRDQF
jgi:hypothetical protein